jgi:hypothetical protein
MEGVKFESVRQVEDLYENLIELYNDVLIEYEEMEAIDDDIQELRNTTLDKYDYSLMAEVYQALGEKETAEDLEEKARECDEVIEDLQKKLEGVDINEHLIKFYEYEVKKENFDIQMKACEKFLEKSQRKREAEKMRSNLRPASPRRFPNLTRVPSPRFIAEDSEESEQETEEEIESAPSTPEAPKPEPKEEPKPTKAKGGKKAASKISLLPVAKTEEVALPPPPPLQKVEEVKEEVKEEPKKGKKGGGKKK